MAGDEHDAGPASGPVPADAETAELAAVGSGPPPARPEEPAPAEPAVAEPEPEPAPAEPVEAEPEPEPAEPAEPQPEPAPAEPAEPQPEPAPADPAVAEPEPEPAPAKPAESAEPQPEPAPAEPQPQPAPADPAAAVAEAEPEPAPAEPQPEASPPAPQSTPAPAAAAAPVSHAMAGRRRRWPWVLLGAVLGAIVALAAAGLWYVSGLVGAGARVPQPDAGFAMTITAADAASVSYDDVSSDWVDEGLMGIATVEGGYVQTADPKETGPSAGVRAVTADVLPPSPAPGDAAVLDGWYFPRNPLIGLGLEYLDVQYDSPLGPTPAWLVPGTSPTWVVFTHGRGATPLEGLRMADTISAEGYPMLLIRYRNDAYAPAGTGYAQFGADEWQDLEAAVQYAIDNGADNVVLAGASMGGSVTLAFLQNSSLADRVVGAFLDSPLTSFGEVVRIGAEDMGLPGVVTDLSMRVASWRYGFDWAATDYVDEAGDFTTPMLIVQGTADTTVPPQVNQSFAAAANPAVVSLEVFEGAGHVLSWNVDRPRYEALLSGFLEAVAPTQ